MKTKNCSINNGDPEIIIKGQPMEIVSVVEDGHGVVWVNVEPVGQRSSASSVSKRSKNE